MVRQGFTSNRPSSPGSFSSNGLTLSPESSNRGPTFRITVVLLDPSCATVPRGNARRNLQANGRILQLAFPRGMQEMETSSFVVNAFPLLRGIHSRNANRGYEVLVTDKTSRNALIPAPSPSNGGFTARELNQIAGQGSLYLRLSDHPDDVNQITRDSAFTGQSSRRGAAWRQSLARQITQTNTASQYTQQGTSAQIGSTRTTAAPTFTRRNTTIPGSTETTIPPRSTRTTAFPGPTWTATLPAVPTRTTAPSVSTSTTVPSVSTRTTVPSGSTRTTAPFRSTRTTAPFRSTRTTAPFRSTRTTAPSGSTRTTVPSGSTRTTAPSGSTRTTASPGSTGMTSPPRSTRTTAPSGSTRTTSPSGSTRTTAPFGSTRTTTPSGSTRTTASPGSTGMTSPPRSTRTTASPGFTGMTSPPRSTRTTAPPSSTRTTAPPGSTRTTAPASFTRTTRTTAPSGSTWTTAPSGSTRTTTSPGFTGMTSPPRSTRTTASRGSTGMTAPPRSTRTTAPPSSTRTTAPPGSTSTTAPPGSTRTAANPGSTRTTAPPTFFQRTTAAATIRRSTTAAATIRRSTTADAAIERSTTTDADTAAVAAFRRLATADVPAAIRRSTTTDAAIGRSTTADVAVDIGRSTTANADAAIAISPTADAAIAISPTADAAMGRSTTADADADAAMGGSTTADADAAIVRSTTADVDAVMGRSTTADADATIGSSTTAEAAIVRSATADAVPDHVVEVSDDENLTDEETVERRGRLWRATLPAEADSDSDDDASLNDLAIIHNATCSGEEIGLLPLAVISHGTENSLYNPPSASISGTIQVPDARVLVELIQLRETSALSSALESSFNQFGHHAKLPARHPCNFNMIMNMASLGGELCRPALLCVVSQRQWHLWRPLLECDAIRNLININLLFWLQSSTSDEGKQALAELKCNSSSNGVLAVTFTVDGNRKVLVKISELVPSASDLVKILTEAIKKFQQEKQRWEELQRTRALKLEQDQAYQASLESDRQKDEYRRNTKETQTEDHEATEQPQEQNENIEPPPKRLRSDSSMRIIVVVPNGIRHVVDIDKSSTLQDVYTQVAALMPDGNTEGVSLSYQVDANVSRSIPNDASITVLDFAIPENCVIRASHAD